MPRKSGPHRELADAIGFKPHYLEHRSRLQDRLLKGGAENLPDYEILEILLAASNPRGDTKPLAKAVFGRRWDQGRNRAGNGLRFPKIRPGVFGCLSGVSRKFLQPGTVIKGAITLTAG